MTNASNPNTGLTLAAVGGGGFLGARMAQMAGSSGGFTVVPILRNYRSLARLGAGIRQARITDTRDLLALTQAVQGCQTVINLTMGDSLGILKDTQLIYQAARAAGARQLIHLSSAVVFGRAKQPGLADDSPPDSHSWMLYARGKAKAEMWLRRQMEKQELQVVVLRPGLIWGPGSNWSEMVADELRRGAACLSNRGAGIANLIYVDNLVRIILTVASRRNGPSGFYNVSDNETITWKQYYFGLARRLGYATELVCLWPDGRFRFNRKHVLEWALERRALLMFAKAVARRLGPRAKALLKTKLKGLPEPPRYSPVSKGPPVLSRAHWVLQNTVHRLPCTKIHRDYGPIELCSFEEALDTTVAWLQFAGYSAPQHTAHLPHTIRSA